MFQVLLALLASLLALGAAAAPVDVVPGEPVVAAQEGPAPRLRLVGKSAVAAATARLPAVSDGEVETVRKANARGVGKRFMIGVNREVPQSPGPLAWAEFEGGKAARVAITSPEASALRLALDLRGIPLEAEMVFFGSGEPARLLGPVRVGSIADRTLPWWSPPTEGETQTVELFVPAAQAGGTFALRVAQVSHLFTSAASGFQKQSKAIGDSGSCNVDIACVSNPSQAFLNTRNAVARMVFTEGAGTVTCTGTLLNDQDAGTQIPWFYSANHCFDTESPPYRTDAQKQVIANTLVTHWFFEAATCRGLATSPNYVTRSGGATFVYSNQASDVLFLRLNDAPPAGAFLTGYSTQPFSAGQTGTGIHHPSGDHKKVSQGSVLGFSSPFSGSTASGYSEIRWSTGTTEGGSSGSGLWYFDGSQYLFRGGLWGGSALCANPQGTDNYSRFDLAYPALRTYLEASSAQPFADFTDLWWGGESQNGWGLNIVQHPSNQVFAVWYTYGSDGKRLWIVMSGGQWTTSSTFTGALYTTTGSPYSAPFNTASQHVTQVGTGTLNFTSANAGTWTYSVNGVSGTKAITRQPF